MDSRNYQIRDEMPTMIIDCYQEWNNSSKDIVEMIQFSTEISSGKSEIE